MSIWITPTAAPQLIASQFDGAALHGSDDATAAIDATDRLVRHDGHLAGWLFSCLQRACERDESLAPEAASGLIDSPP